LALRIAHFIQRYPPALGGSEAYFARLSRYLASAGDRVTVFTTNALSLSAFWSKGGERLEPGRSLEAGVEVRRYGLAHFPGRRYLLKALSLVPHRPWQCLTLPCNPMAWGMWRDCRRPQRFDIVHATAFPYAWPIACGLSLARRLGVPFLLTPFLHVGNPDDPRDPTRRAYTSAALLSLAQAADRVFVQTEGERLELERQGVTPGKLTLQGLGVSLEECTGGDRDRARQAWQVQPGEVVVGHLANNSREKGSIDLLDAALRLWESGLPLRLVLAGPEMPNFLDYWSQVCGRLPSPASVLRLGVLSEEHKRDFFAGLDVFALPSRSDSFGLVLLEAWANQVANVGYRAGGIADVVRHETDGLLVPCGDVGALAGALSRVIGDAPLRRRLGAAGRARLPLEFRWDDKLALVRQTYHELAGSSRAATVRERWAAPLPHGRGS
jgi:glycosyltransferase involved in cell wall biosynthesis